LLMSKADGVLLGWMSEAPPVRVQQPRRTSLSFRSECSDLMVTGSRVLGDSSVHVYPMRFHVHVLTYKLMLKRASTAAERAPRIKHRARKSAVSFMVELTGIAEVVGRCRCSREECSRSRSTIMKIATPPPRTCTYRINHLTISMARAFRVIRGATISLMEHAATSLCYRVSIGYARTLSRVFWSLQS
jgi:hypothetical protein